jgi:hypothetical protein
MAMSDPDPTGARGLRRVAGLLLALLVCSGLVSGRADAPGLLPAQAEALRALARGQEFAWPALTAGQSRELHAKAEDYLRLYQQHHLPHGLHVNVWWTDYDRTGVDNLEGCGDSACWTGHYLAALALKYSVTRDSATLAAIGAVVDKLDLLSVVSGRAGYIARYVGPAEDRGYQAYYSHYGRDDPTRPGFGKKAFPGVPPHEDLVWLGHSSRDSYDGVNLGLAMTWAYVPDPAVRARIRLLVERVGNRLVADGFAVVDGQGNQWEATDTFKASWMRTMMTVAPERFSSLQGEYAQALRTFAGIDPRSLQDEEYFSMNLAFARIAAIAVLEQDAAAQSFIKGTVRAWYRRQLKGHLNAHFSALYLLITGDESEAARASVQGLLVDYPPGPKWVRLVDYRRDPEVVKHAANFAEHAMLPHERVPDEFQWQWSAALLYRWDRSIPMELPGLDVVLPYWCGRATGAIPPP